MIDAHPNKGGSVFMTGPSSVSLINSFY